MPRSPHVPSVSRREQSGKLRLSTVFILCAFLLVLSATPFITGTFAAEDNPQSSLLSPQSLSHRYFPREDVYTRIRLKTGSAEPFSPLAACTWTGGGADTNWSTAGNWSGCTGGGAPTSTDTATISTGGTVTITGVPTTTIQELHIQGSTTVNLTPASGVVSLSISGGTSPIDLEVASGSALNITGGSTSTNTLQISVGTGAIGSITGSMTFSQAQHQLLAADASGITFTSGSSFTYNPGGTSGSVFGTTGTANTVVFASGSTYVFQGGANPFGLAQPSSKVVFQAGSLFKQTGTGTPSFSGRTYANFELNNGSANITVIGGAAVSINDLAITTGTLNFNMTATPGHAIKGNISVASGATLNFNPASAGTVNLSGTSAQTISGSGTITTGANSTLAVTNASGVSLSSGATMTLGGAVTDSTSLTVNGTLNCGTSTVSGAGTFTLASGGTLGIGDTNGITSSGATGNIQTTTRTFNGGGNYTYNGSAAQVTGNGLPTSLSGTLTINNSAGVTLSQVAGSTGTLTLTSGTFATGSNYSQSGGTISRSAGSITGTPSILSPSLIYTGSSAVTTGLEVPTNGNILGLTVNNTGGVTMGANINVGNAGTVGSGASLSTSTFTLNPTSSFANSGTINVDAGGSYASGVLTNSGVCNVNGTFQVIAQPTGNSLVYGANSTLAYATLVSTSSTNVEFPASNGPTNVTIAVGANTLSLHADRTIGGTLTLTSGAFSIGGNTLTLNGAISTTSGSLTGGSTSKISFGGSGASTTLPAVSGGLNTLTINRANGISLGGAVSVSGTLNLTSGTLANGASLTLGDLTTINRASTGAITGTPAFTNRVFLNYTGGGDYTTGPELPASASAVRDFVTTNPTPFTLTLGSNLTVNNVFLVNGGSIDTGANTLTLSGGTNQIGSGTVTVGSGGTFNVNNSLAFLVSGVGIVVNGTLSQPSGAVISGAGTLTVNSGGTATLGAANTYTGATSVSGTLAVNGSTTAGSAVSVNSGGTLKGTGTVSGPTTVASGGIVAPGASPGILNSGNVSFTSGSNFNVELNGTTVGTQYDQLNVTGTVALGGATLNVTLGFTPAANDAFTIINNDSTDGTGTFAGLAEGATFTVSGTTFKISYVGGDGNDVVLTAQAPGNTISGTLSGASSVSGKTIKLFVNGGSAATTTTTGGGAYTFSGVTLADSDRVIVFVDGDASFRGATVTKAASPAADITGLDIAQNELTIRHEDSGPVTNTDLDTADSGADADIPFTVTTGNLTTNDGIGLTIHTSKTYAPGGNASIGGNWTNNGTFTHGGNTVTFNGTGAQTVTAGGTGAGKQFSTLIVNKSTGTATLGGDLAVTTALTVSAGTLDISTFTVTPVGLALLTLASGTTMKVGGANNYPAFGAQTLNNNSTVDFNRDGDQTIPGQPFGQLVLSGTTAAQNKTPAAAITVISLTVGTNVTCAGGAALHQVFGTLTNNGTVSHSSTLKVGGAFTNTGTYTNTGTLEFNGTLNQGWSDSNSQNFGNVVVNKASNAVQLSSNITVNALTLTAGPLAVGANTLTINGAVSAASGSLTSAATGTVNYNQGSNGQSVLAGQYGNLTFSNFNKTLASSGTIGIAGTFTPGTATGHTTNFSTIEFNGTSAQTVPLFHTYYNLTLNNAAGTTGTAGLKVNDTLTVQAGTFSSASDYHHVVINSGGTLSLSNPITVSGDWTNNGTFTNNGHSVTFDGTGVQTITTGGSGAGKSFAGFAVNKATGTASLAGDLRAASLTVTAGAFDQGASSNVLTTGSGTVATVAANGIWQNFGTGDLTLSGDITNNGTINFNGNGTACNELATNDISISSTGAARTWSGTGTFSMTDVTVSNQSAGTPPVVILVNSGTDGGGNTGWTFVDQCTAGTYTWIGGTIGVNTDWQVSTNWNPTRATPAVGDILIFDANATPGPTVTNVPTQTIAKLQLKNGVNAVTLNAAIAGAQTLTVTGNAGLDIAATNLLTLSGANGLTIAVTTGTASTIGGHIILQGGPHRLTGDNAGQIVFANGSIFTTTSGFTGNPFGTGTDGSVIFQSGASAFFNAGSDPFGGSGKTIVTFNLGSNQELSTATAWAAEGRTYGNLTLTGTSQTYFDSTASTQVTVTGNLTIGTGGNTLRLSNTSGGDLNLFGNFTDNGTFDPNGRTIKFQGGSLTQTITKSGTETFFDVLIAKTGGSVVTNNSLVINGALSFNGTLDVLDMAAGTLQLNGTVGGSNATGALKATVPGSSLLIGGTGALGTLRFVSGSESVTSLTVNRTSSGSVVLGTNLNVGDASLGGVNLTNGVVDMGSNTLSLAEFPTMNRTNGYVIGNVKKTFGATGAFDFAVGTANGYSPVGVNVTGNSFPASLTVKAVQGQHPNISGANALQRYWTLTETGDLLADLTFNWGGGAPAAGDVVGTEANYKIFKYAGSFAQIEPDVLNTTSHFATKNGVSDFSDWTLAEAAAVQEGSVAFFDGATSNIAEGNAGPTVKNVCVTRSGGTDGAVSVNYATSDGTAQDDNPVSEDNDYVATSGTLNWAHGQGGDQCFNVTINGDTNVEPDETINITLSSATGGLTIGQSGHIINVTNDDAAPGAALDFDGVDDYIEVPSAPALHPSVGITMEAWVKPTNGGTYARIMDTSDASGSADAILFLKFGTNAFRFLVNVNGTVVVAASPTTWVPGTWYHVAGTYDGCAVRLFVDGTQVAATAASGPIQTANNTLLIGSGHDPYYFQGQMDDVRLWGRALGSDEIQAHMNCELVGNETGLAAYYKFNQGTAGANNSGVTTATDSAGGDDNGTLNNFALTGSTSNWVAPGAVVTGATCTAFTAPDINVKGNGNSICDGDSTPSATDDTEFGNVSVGSNLSRTFTIENTGTATLNLTGTTPNYVTISGTNASDFTVTTQPSTTSVGSGGGTTTFIVQFAPGATGLRTATVHIASDDADEADYDFAIQGTGTAAPTQTDVTLSIGDLIVTDINGGTSNDTLTISLVSGNIRVTDPGNTLACGAGTTQVDANTCDVPSSSVTGNIQVNTLGGNDTLTIDYNGGVITQPISYDGGTQTTADTLVIGGGSTFTNVTHTLNSASSGSISATGVGTVTYTGLEPVTDNLSAVDRVFTFTGGAEIVTLNDAAGANMTIDSTLSESVTFANPTGSLTVNLGTGNNAITVGSVDADGPFNRDLTINGGVDGDSIIINANITFAAGESLDLNLQNDDVTPGIDTVFINSQLITSGTGVIDIRASQDVIVNSPGVLRTQDGNLTIEANQQATRTVGENNGVDINGSTVESTGSGNISIKGRGGEGTFDVMYGVIVFNGGKVLSTGTGSITVEGVGGNRTGPAPGGLPSSDLIGVYVYLTGSEISSVSGPITITGTGGDTNYTGSYGVSVAGGKVETSGAGLLTINGNGGTVPAGQGSATFVDSAGVFVVQDDDTVPAAGIVRSTGTGSNAGNIVITGISGSGGTGSAQGVRVDTPGSVTTVDGSITITGTGGACQILCLGTSIRGPVTASGTGAIALNGTGGTSAVATQTHGVNVRSGGNVSVNSGDLTVTGTGGNTADNPGFALAPSGTGTLQTTGSGNIFINADRVRIITTPSATINAGANAVSFRQLTNGALINLGSIVDSTAGTLELSDAELDRVTAGALNIGNNNSGTITVSNSITRAAATNMVLTSDGDVIISGGEVNTGGGTLLLDPGAAPDAVKPTKSSTDVTASTLAIGSDLGIVINGTAVDTDYTQLNVVGMVDLAGDTLALSGTHIPVTGQSFIIVNNDGTGDAITGTFAAVTGGTDANGGALAEGDTITNFLGTGASATISYLGNDGNDVVLAVTCTVPPTPTITPSGAVSFCDSGLLTSSSATGNQWYKDNVLLAGETNQTLTVTTSGAYTVTVTDSTCTSAPSAATTVTINPTPATPTASNGGPYCEGATIQLSTPTVSGATYSWTGPNGFTSSDQNPTRTNATTADAGTYSVTITANGCTSAAGNTNVVVNATPATPTASNGGPYCEGATIQLSTPTVSGATYSWTGPNAFTSSAQNPTISNATTADAGTYFVTVTVNGCTSAAGSTTVAVNSCSDLSVTKSAPAAVTEGNNFTYTITVANLASTGSATGVTLTDTLPAGVTFVSVSPTPACSGGATVSCSLPDIPAGGNQVVTIVVTAGAPGSVDNSASASAANDTTSPNLSNTTSTTINAAACAAPPAGMVGWWPGDGNSLDIQGPTFENGTLLGGATASAAGKVSGAFEFTGASGGAVSAPFGAGVFPSSSNGLTIDAWVNLDNFDGTFDGIVSAVNTGGGGGANNTRARLGTYAAGGGGGIYGHVRNPSGGYDVEVSLPAHVLSANTWHHVAMTAAPNAPIRIYVDGVLVISSTSNLGAALPADVDSVFIGSGEQTNVFNADGRVDEVEILDRALDANEIAAIYNASFAGKCRTCTAPPANMTSWWDGSGTAPTANDIAGAHHGTFQGNAAFAPGKVGQGFTFDGSGDSVQVPDSPAWFFDTNDFTIDLWANFNSLNTSNPLVSNDEGGGSTNKWIFWIDSNNLAVHLNTTGGAASSASAAFTPVTNRWYHLAVVKSGTTYTFYVDGVAIGSQVNAQAVPDANATLNIGSAESFFSNARMDEVEIFQRALSATEIAALANAGNEGKCHTSTVTVEVAPVSVTEDGATNLAYTFRRNGDNSGAATVNFAISGTASFSGGDYSQSGAATFDSPSGQGTVSFSAGETTKTVTIDPATDTTDEPDETVILTVTSGTGYDVGTPDTATGTITDDDATPAIMINNVTQPEGNAGTTSFTFTVSLSNPSSTAVTVDYDTVPGTTNPATEGPCGGSNDYQSTFGTVTFNPGQTSNNTSIVVPVCGEATPEADETFFVNLSNNSGNSTLAAGTKGTGTITNDDSLCGNAVIEASETCDDGNTNSGDGCSAACQVENLVTVSVSPASVTENGPTDLVYTFSRTLATGPQTIDFSVGGTATLNTDYTVSGADTFTAVSGTVTFSGTDSTTTVTINPSPDGTPEVDETVQLTVTPGAGYFAGTPASASGTIANDDESATAGQLTISEFRFSGPGANAGLQDANEFIELYNSTNQDILVTTTDGSSGWAVATSAGAAIFVIPNGTTIPARGHFLGTNSVGYSLKDYGGTDAALGDTSWVTDYPDNTAMAVFRTSNAANFNTTNRLDSVGPNTEGNTLYKEGAGYAPLSTPNLEHTFFRQICVFQAGCPTPGRPRDTNDNSADFIFADTAGTPTSAGERLGAPGPENLASPIKRDPAINLVFLDATVENSAAPNRARNPTPIPGANFGTMTIRRRIVNQTGTTVTRLRLRVIDMTTHPSGSLADLRLRSSTGEIINGINDANTCSSTGTPASAPCQVTVEQLTLDQPPTQPSDGGLNSTVTLALPSGLAPGASINVNFLLGVQQTGSFRFYLVIEALP